MYRIIYLGPHEGFDAAREVLKEYAELRHICTKPNELAKALPLADALLDASMQVTITDDMIQNAPRLKVISCATTGSDHIHRTEINRRKISVHTLKEDPKVILNLTPAAELSWALLMACARKLTAAVEHVKNGNWAREEFPGIMLKGKQIGIVGCGRIGRWMSRYAMAFGMRVVGYDPFVNPFPEGIEKIDMETLFKTSDFISIHVHLTDSTKGLISSELLAIIKPGAIFINTSRGGLVDEMALLEALKSGRIAAAGLDVLQGEPEITKHPLVCYSRSHANLIITPHCGGFSPEAVETVCRHAACKIIKYLV